MKGTRKAAVNALLILAGTVVGIIIAVMQPSSSINPFGVLAAMIVGIGLGLLIKRPFGGMLVVALANVTYLYLAPHIISALNL